jgi:hypothetical protein
MFMRESGFRRQPLPGQRELVRAVAHIAPAGSLCTSNQAIRSLGSAPRRRQAATRESPPGVGYFAERSSAGKRAIEQTPLSQGVGLPGDPGNPDRGRS